MQKHYNGWQVYRSKDSHYSSSDISLNMLGNGPLVLMAQEADCPELVEFCFLEATMSHRSGQTPLFGCWCTHLFGQTTATGALTGEVLDLSGAVIPDAALRLTKEETNTVLPAMSDDLGRFSFLLLAPGNYQLDVSKTDFRGLTLSGLVISVTETLRVDPRLQLATQLQTTEVLTQPMMIQTAASALGRVVNETTLNELRWSPGILLRSRAQRSFNQAHSASSGNQVTLRDQNYPTTRAGAERVLIARTGLF